MLDDNIKQNLRKVLEEKLEMLLLDRESLEKLKAQITETEEQVFAIKKVLGDEDAYIFDNRSRIKPPVKSIEPKKGSVTDSIRLILEKYPEITPEKGIRLVKEKHPSSNIDKNINEKNNKYNAWNQWSMYFKTGKYRMDANAYRRRYKQEPPY